MIFRTVASANGVVSLAYGAVALVIPAVISSFYGIEITDREGMAVRLPARPISPLGSSPGQPAA